MRVGRNTAAVAPNLCQRITYRAYARTFSTRLLASAQISPFSKFSHAKRVCPIYADMQPLK
jgi:hypothetical protein